MTTHDLRSGHCVSCGASEHKIGRAFSDLTGKRIGKLLVQASTDKRDKKGSVIWKCRCDCGQECEYSQDSLIHGGVVSCGCYRRTVNVQKMQEARHFIDGTCVEALQRKMRSDNTSGFTGVYLCAEKGWRANITFKQKRYSLGTYQTLEDAVNARKKGERLHLEFLEQFYDEQMVDSSCNEGKERHDD